MPPVLGRHKVLRAPCWTTWSWMPVRCTTASRMWWGASSRTRRAFWQYGLLAVGLPGPRQSPFWPIPPVHLLLALRFAPAKARETQGFPLTPLKCEASASGQHVAAKEIKPPKMNCPQNGGARHCTVVASSSSITLALRAAPAARRACAPPSQAPPSWARRMSHRPLRMAQASAVFPSCGLLRSSPLFSGSRPRVPERGLVAMDARESARLVPLTCEKRLRAYLSGSQSNAGAH